MEQSIIIDTLETYHLSPQYFLGASPYPVSTRISLQGRAPTTNKLNQSDWDWSPSCGRLGHGSPSDHARLDGAIYHIPAQAGTPRRWRWGMPDRPSIQSFHRDKRAALQGKCHRSGSALHLPRRRLNDFKWDPLGDLWSPCILSDHCGLATSQV